MIGKLRGTVDSHHDDHVILDVGGVGYEVHCPVRVLQGLPPVGEAATLSIETFVREDQIRLYGFATPLERQWFRLLMTVQGVGAKVALALLGIMKPGDLANAIALRDIAAITEAPGIGKKVAERICSELKTKAPTITGVDAGLRGLADDLAEGRAARSVTDAVSALVNLGYTQPQASAAVAAAARTAGDDATAERLIRLGLKELGR